MESSKTEYHNNPLSSSPVISLKPRSHRFLPPTPNPTVWARLSVPMLAVLWELAQDYIWAVLWLAWWFLAWVRYSLLESALLLLSDWVVPRPAARLAMQPNTRWMKVFPKMTSLCIVNC